MAITTQMRTDVAGLYAALFGRAPERDGLGYWVQQLDAGKTVADVAQAMYNVDAARATYPLFLTNQEIIGKFYTNVLGRTADADGLAYWTAKLNGGATQGQVISDMITAVKAYAGTDAAALASQSLFNNKVSVGLNYAVTLGLNDVAQAAAVLNLVTATDTTAANNLASGVSTAGQTFTLTTGVDSITGTSGNDTIIVDNTGTKQLSVADKIDGGAGTDTLKIYMASGDTSLALGTISNVENIYLNSGSLTSFNASTITGVTGLTIDGAQQTAANAAAAATGSYGVVTTDTLTVAGQSITLTNLAPSVANTSAAAAYTAGTTTASASAFVTSIASTTDTAESVTLNKVTGGSHTYTDTSVGGLTTTFTDVNVLNFAGAKVATANLTATGSASTITLQDSGAALSTINISGDQALTLTVGGNALQNTAAAAAGFASTGIAAINASNATGAVSVTMTAAASATTGDNLATSFAFTGGSGNDTLDLTNAQVGGSAVTAAQLNAMKFDGGAGTDTLVLNNSIVTGATALTTLTNFEVIGDAAASGTVNMTNFGSATGFKFTGNLAGGVTLNNLPSTATLDFGTATVAGNTVTVNALGNGTSDALSVTLGSSTAGIGAATAATTINGYETVNITSQGAANTLQNLTLGASAGGAEALNITATKALTTGTISLSGSSTAITVTGAGNLSTGAITAGSFTDTGTGTITVATGSNILNFNAGTNNANTSILDTNASSAASITTGNGTNTITGGAFNDVIKTGTGANTITGGAGADNITVGTHTSLVDKIVQAAVGDSGTFTAPATNTISTSTFDVVNGLVKGDQLQVVYAGNVNTTLTTGSMISANAATATTLVGATVADNGDLIVRGTYTASTNTFVGSATGNDSLFIYDANSTSGATAAEAIVLVGYVAASATGINGNAGLITLG